MSRWLWSQKALSLFHYAAWVVVCVGMFMTFMATPWFWQLAAMPRGQLLLRILGGTAGVLGGPASLVLIFGMTVSCIREDNSSTSTKVFGLSSVSLLHRLAPWSISSAFIGSGCRLRVTFTSMRRSRAECLSAVVSRAGSGRGPSTA
jgi:hypothetical protein